MRIFEVSKEDKSKVVYITSTRFDVFLLPPIIKIAGIYNPQNKTLAVSNYKFARRMVNKMLDGLSKWNDKRQIKIDEITITYSI